MTRAGPHDAHSPRGSTSETSAITQRTYDAIAVDFLERTRDTSRGRPWLDRFAAVLPGKTRVLDLGSGPGRDAAALRARGLRAFCLDRSVGMLRAGREAFPADRVQADCAALPLGDGSVGGVWANASLLHLDTGSFAAALAEIGRVLAPGGSLHVSLKRGEGSEWETERYGAPRYFRYWSGRSLDEALRLAGFRIEASALEATRSAVWLIRQCTVSTTERVAVAT